MPCQVISSFYFAQQIIYQSIDFLFFHACWLFMNEFVNMFPKSMNEIVHTIRNLTEFILCADLILILILTFQFLGIKSGQAFQSVDPPAAASGQNRLALLCRQHGPLKDS